MTLPGFCASRSSTVHRTLAPVETSVTVTTAPKAKVGLAQVPAAEPYHEASPVVACTGAGGGPADTGFGVGTTTGVRAGGLGTAVMAPGTAAIGFGTEITGDDGSGAVVVGAGNTRRNETFTTRVFAPTPVFGDAGVVDDASDRDGESMSRVKRAGVDHEVDRRDNISSARP